MVSIFAISHLPALLKFDSCARGVAFFSYTMPSTLRAACYTLRSTRCMLHAAQRAPALSRERKTNTTASNSAPSLVRVGVGGGCTF